MLSLVSARATVATREPIAVDLHLAVAQAVDRAAASVDATGLLVPTLPVSRYCLTRHAALMVLAALPPDMTVARAVEVIAEAAIYPGTLIPASAASVAAN